MMVQPCVNFAGTFFILTISCLVVNQVSSGPTNHHGNRVTRATHRAFDNSCGKTYNMESAKNKKIQHGKGKGSCAWIFVGTEECHPQIKCPTLDLPKSEDCAEVSLTISDGIGGQSKFCGPSKFTKPKIASKGGRDLFVTFETQGKGYGNGFECEITCSENAAAADILPPEGVVSKEEFKCVCGLQNKDDRIVGGEDTKLNEFPWQVALVRPGTRSPMCGGSVINNRYILTAAHCFLMSTPHVGPEKIEVLIHANLLDFTVVKQEASKNIKLGESGSMQASGYNLAKKKDADEKTQRFKVEKIISHGLFTPGYDFDISLLRLDRKINLLDQDAPTPICLPKPASYDQLYHGEKPTVTGWGLAHELAGATTRLQQKLEVPVIPLDDCKVMMPQTLTQRMLCAGYKEGLKDACMGDSGGPLGLKMPNKQWQQIGIVSWGEGCAKEERPGLYSRVTEFIQWINHHANQPGTVWCRADKN